MWYKLDYNTALPSEKIWAKTDKFIGQSQFFLTEVKTIKSTEHLSEKFTLDKITLEKKSQFLDVIYCPECALRGLIISEKLYTILLGVKLMNVRFYEVQLSNNKIEKKYFFMRVAGDLTEHIDFNRTVFHLYKKGVLVKEFKCADKNDYLVKREEQIDFDPINPIKAVQIFFNDSFYDLNYDLITLGMLNPLDILINDKLKKRLESENLIGLRIEPFMKIQS